jgi:uncharacterized protein
MPDLVTHPAPGVYTGRVRHRRFSPLAHSFEYPLFMVLLDIDRIPQLMQASPLLAYNRPALLSYRERDHFGDPALPLRQRLNEDAARHGHTLPNGPIFLLTHLAYAGYCFNPISLYYCYEPNGELALQMAEVHSTFGEQHNYWLSSPRATATKQMHVSPFNTMDNDYHFALSPPARRLTAHIDNLRAGEKFFDATLMLDFEPWSPAALHKAAALFPFMTLQVIAAIHWEALKLFFQRLPLVPHQKKILKP